VASATIDLSPIHFSVRRLRDLTVDPTRGLALLRSLKFSEFGRHPLEDRNINLIEQVNQTWTYLVSLQVLPFLFVRHPKAGGFRLNLGAEGDIDITSLVPRAVAAEAFAEVDLRNNRIPNAYNLLNPPGQPTLRR
jgi:hypothetical protein